MQYRKCNIYSNAAKTSVREFNNFNTGTVNAIQNKFEIGGQIKSLLLLMLLQ